jgi:DNA repair protein RadC
MRPITKISELKVSYKLNPDLEKLPTISSSTDAYLFMYSFFPADTIALQEHFFVAYLNRANKVVGVYHSSVGGISATVADPRLILGTALKLAASSLILAHNHPSGALKASLQDDELTQKLVAGSRLLDLKVLDHIIVAPEKGKYFSFADEGML